MSDENPNPKLAGLVDSLCHGLSRVTYPIIKGPPPDRRAKCPTHGAVMRRYDGPVGWYRGEGTTLVGYSSPPGHDHDDNCVKRYYVCPECPEPVALSIVRTCSHPDCYWEGKVYCFCHPGPKLREWPLDDPDEQGELS